jgi:ABC-2 type transport system permease protein
MSNPFKALLKADFIVQWRQRRALFMSLLMPVIFVVSWKSLIPEIGAAGVLSICIAIGLPATGLMGYAGTMARDRERGVFQRLRSTPISSRTIIMSRLIVQLAVIALITLVTCFFAYYVDHISIGFLELLLILIASVVGGAAYLAIGQFVVAFVKSSEGVNAATRLLYFPLSIVGALGTIGLFGTIVKNIITWSPFGTTQTLLQAAIDPSHMTIVTLWALLGTLAYGIVFASIGIKWFQWSSN